MPTSHHFRLAVLLGVVACGGSEPTATTPPTTAPTTPIAATATVYMNPNSFSPFAVTITVGGSVNYEFPSLAHNVIFTKKTGAPADIQSTTNRSVSRTFSVVGTFPYDCTLHPGMSGEVIVK